MGIHNLIGARVQLPMSYGTVAAGEDSKDQQKAPEHSNETLTGNNSATQEQDTVDDH